MNTLPPSARQKILFDALKERVAANYKIISQKNFSARLETQGYKKENVDFKTKLKWLFSRGGISRLIQYRKDKDIPSKIVLLDVDVYGNINEV